MCRKKKRVPEKCNQREHGMVRILKGRDNMPLAAKLIIAQLKVGFFLKKKHLIYGLIKLIHHHIRKKY